MRLARARSAISRRSTRSTLAALAAAAALATAGLVVPILAAPATIPDAAAEETARRASISLSPSSGPPGSAFTIAYRDFAKNCRQIQFFWDSRPLASLPGQESGSIRVTVPGNARLGMHVVTGQACQSLASAPFLVPAPAPTTAPPTRPPSSLPPTTAPPTTAPPTTAPATTVAAAPSASATASSTVTRSGRLTFGKPVVQAGETLSASGTGCDPNSLVTLTSNGEQVGTTIADSTGSFSAPVQFSRLRPGHRMVTANCGGNVLTGGVDLTMSTTASGSTGVFVVLGLVLLAGVTLAAHYRTRDRTNWWAGDRPNW